MQRVAPQRLLLSYAVINIGLLCIAVMASGWLAIWSLWLTTLFMSIMWPTVFALGVRDLGPLTKMGSSLMVMAIVGGAVFPPVMGYIADLSGSIHASLLVPMTGFFMVFYHAGWGWNK